MPPAKAKKAAKEKDLLARLADAGEEALQRIAELPGGSRAVSAFNELRHRVDELARRVGGVEALERRVARLEKELAALRASAEGRARSPRGRSRSGSSGESAPPEAGEG